MPFDVTRTRSRLILLRWGLLSQSSAAELMQTARSICFELVTCNGRHLLEKVRGSSARIELTRQTQRGAKVMGMSSHRERVLNLQRKDHPYACVCSLRV